MRKRLLVVDDEAKLLRAVAVTLREEGYEVTTARSGAEALVSINASVPDFIVSDIRMPGMDGYQLARALRSNPRTELIPVIFLTAKDERKDRLAGIRAGVDAYLTKPFDPEELLAVVANILTRAERTSAELARLVSTPTGAESSPSQFAPDEDCTDAEGRVARLVADGLLMSVLQPFAALYVLILASASPLLAKESERIYALSAKLFSRLGQWKTPDQEVEEAQG